VRQREGEVKKQKSRWPWSSGVRRSVFFGNGNQVHPWPLLKRSESSGKGLSHDSDPSLFFFFFLSLSLSLFTLISTLGESWERMHESDPFPLLSCPWVGNTGTGLNWAGLDWTGLEGTVTDCDREEIAKVREKNKTRATVRESTSLPASPPVVQTDCSAQREHMSAERTDGEEEGNKQSEQALF